MSNCLLLKKTLAQGVIWWNKRTSEEDNIPVKGITFISGRAAAVGETPHFLIWWVLEFPFTSQHMCLFIESREVLCVNVVNICVLLRHLWLIISVEFINFKFQLFIVLIKWVLVCSVRSIYAITIPNRFPALLISPLHHIVAMSFIWKVGEGVAASIHEDWNRRRKNYGRDAALN